jgi:hypothetical protein
MMKRSIGEFLIVPLTWTNVRITFEIPGKLLAECKGSFPPPCPPLV